MPRRAFLHGLTTLPLIGGSVAHAHGGGSELNALFADWRRKRDELEALPDPSDDEVTRRVHEINDLEFRIYDYPSSVEALKVKARGREAVFGPAALRAARDDRDITKASLGE